MCLTSARAALARARAAACALRPGAARSASGSSSLHSRPSTCEVKKEMAVKTAMMTSSTQASAEA